MRWFEMKSDVKFYYNLCLMFFAIAFLIIIGIFCERGKYIGDNGLTIALLIVVVLCFSSMQCGAKCIEKM